MNDYLYFHITADYCRLAGSSNWSATIHTFVRNDDTHPDVRFTGVGDLTFSDLHEVASVLRAVYTNVAIEQCGAQLALEF